MSRTWQLGAFPFCQFVVWAGDGELDEEEMKKVKAAEQLEKMNKNELKKLMADKGLDNSGVRKRTLVKRICQSEHDPVKMLGELGGTVTQAGDDSDSVLDKDALTVEMAEYFKKTVSELAFRWHIRAG